VYPKGGEGGVPCFSREGGIFIEKETPSCQERKEKGRGMVFFFLGGKEEDSQPLANYFANVWEKKVSAHSVLEVKEEKVSRLTLRWRGLAGKIASNNHPVHPFVKEKKKRRNGAFNSHLR